MSILVLVPLIRDITQDLFSGVKISANECADNVYYFTLLQLKKACKNIIYDSAFLELEEQWRQKVRQDFQVRNQL